MNSITLQSSELKTALTGLGKVVSRKSTLPVLGAVKLSRDNQGRISLAGSDLDTFASYQVLDPQPGEPWDVLLPFDQLQKTVKGSTGEVVVQEESQDKAKLRFQVANSALEQTLVTLPVVEFPATPTIHQKAVPMPPNFGETLRQAFETSSDDSSRFVIQGAYLDVSRPDCHTIVSTNGRALFAANTFKFELKESVNLFRSKFLSWLGLWEGDCEMAVQSGRNGGGWIKLTTSHWNCVVKQIEGNYPNWRQVVPTDTKEWTRVQLSDAAVSQILSLSAKLPGNTLPDRTVRLKAAVDLQLEGRDQETDWTGAVIAGATITGKPVSICVNREYLQSALRCGLNEIALHSDLDPMVFTCPGKQMVVMPVRPIPPTTAKPAPQPASVPAKAEALPERKPDMPKTVTTPPSTPATPTPESPFKQATQQLDQLRDSIKNVLRDVGSIADWMKLAEKEKRAGEKEIELFRDKLRAIQDIKI